MAINVKLGGAPTPQPINTTIGVSINSSSPKIGVAIKNPNLNEIKFKLNMRKAINGDLMIFDHPDIDIVYMVEKKKIVSFAKDIMSDMTYGTSSRLLERLRKKGLLIYDSIQGGNVYGSLEGQVMEAASEEDKEMLIPLILNQISEWIDAERPYFAAAQQYDDLLDQNFTDPTEEDSTALGKVPQKTEKGSIPASDIGIYGYSGYGY